MRQEELQTLQSAVELDKIHNEGKLFRALQSNKISVEDFVSTVFGLVQKKNAQNETQKLLSQLASANGGVVGDYWEREQPSFKDRIINKLLYDRRGEFNTENIKKIALTLLGVSAVSYLFAKNGVRKFSNYFKKRASRKEHYMRQKKEAHIKRIKIQYQKKLEQLNQILENADLTEEKRLLYEKMKEETENILNNNDNSVGGIVVDK